MPARQQAGMDVGQAGHAAPRQHQETQSFNVNIWLRLGFNMRDHGAGVPNVDAANAEIATRFRAGTT